MGGRSRCVWMLASGAFLTQLADVFPELLEGRVQAFRVGGDFGGVQHEGHAVHLLPQAGPLHVAQSLVHRLIRTELITEGELVLGVTVATVAGTKGRLIHQTAIQRKPPALTLYPSGTKPLMTARTSWREGPVMAPSPRPMVSHSISPLGWSPLRPWILKNCSWAQHEGSEG